MIFHPFFGIYTHRIHVSLYIVQVLHMATNLFVYFFTLIFISKGIKYEIL